MLRQFLQFLTLLSSVSNLIKLLQNEFLFSSLCSSDLLFYGTEELQPDPLSLTRNTGSVGRALYHSRILSLVAMILSAFSWLHLVLKL